MFQLDSMVPSIRLKPSQAISLKFYEVTERIVAFTIRSILVLSKLIEKTSASIVTPNYRSPAAELMTVLTTTCLSTALFL